MNDNQRNDGVKTDRPGEQQGVARPTHITQADKKMNRDDGADVAEIANKGERFTNESCDKFDKDGTTPAGQAGG